MKKIHNKNKILKLGIPVVALILIFLVVVCFLRFTAPKSQSNSSLGLQVDGYEAVFLSQFPIDSYKEEDFSTFRGVRTLKISSNIPDFDTLKKYLEEIEISGDMVHTIYLGVRPDLLSAEEMVSLAENYSDFSFEVLLASPSMDYWSTLSSQEYTTLLNAYKDFTTKLVSQDNIQLFDVSQASWVISNPGNYLDSFSVNTETAQKIFLYVYCDKAYRLTPENVASQNTARQEIIDNYRQSPPVYPDFSDWCIVFFGDSIIGNYTGSFSIPGAVSSLSHARVYNCGYGGNSAAFQPDKPITLSGITDAFIKKDLSSLPADTQVLSGISEYVKDSPEYKQLCFVINYGLNDYFEGLPVNGEDPYDINYFAGALRNSVKTLQNHFPDAKILLITPNFTSYYENGTLANSEVGGILSDYADAVLEVASERNVLVLDNFHELNITPANYAMYLADGCHPNEDLRLIMAQRIIEALR